MEIDADDFRSSLSLLSFSSDAALAITGRVAYRYRPSGVIELARGPQLREMTRMEKGKEEKKVKKKLTTL